MTNTTSKLLHGVVTTKAGKRIKGKWTAEQLNARKDLDRFDLEVTRADISAAAQANRQTSAEKLEQERSDILASGVSGGPQELWEAPSNPAESHFAAVLSGGPLKGRARELNAELKIPERNADGLVQFPIPPSWCNASIPEPRPGQTEVMLSAYSGSRGPGDTMITAASTTSTTYAPHPAGVAVFGTVYPPMWVTEIGGMVTRVPAGIRDVGWVSVPPVAGERAEGTVTDSTATTVTSNKLVPKRVDAVSETTVELEALNNEAISIVQAELLASVSDQIQKLVLAEVASEVAAPGTDPTTEATFIEIASLVSALVDGRFAPTEQDIRLLTSPRFNAFAAGKFQTAGDYSALARLRDMVGRYQTTAYMSGTTEGWVKNSGNDRFADVLSVAQRGSDALLVCLWPSMSIGADPYSRHGAGRVMWAQSLFAKHVEVGTARTDVIQRTRVKTA